jgi:hypothetical protein
MWLCRRYCSGGTPKFFRITFCHDNLKNHYETNFALIQHHKYSLTELDNLIPWEKSIYVSMLIKYIEEENEKIKQMNASKKR